MKCNGCWNEVEAKAQCVATHCGHLFCKSPALPGLHSYMHETSCKALLISSDQHTFLAFDPAGLKCAQSILESDESACLICENLLTKRYATALLS